MEIKNQIFCTLKVWRKARMGAINIFNETIASESISISIGKFLDYCTKPLLVFLQFTTPFCILFEFAAASL